MLQYDQIFLICLIIGVSEDRLHDSEGFGSHTALCEFLLNSWKVAMDEPVLICTTWEEVCKILLDHSKTRKFLYGKNGSVSFGTQNSSNFNTVLG